MTQELDEEILYGQDSEERIVAIEPLEDRHLNKIFTRTEDDHVKSRIEKSDLFLYINSKDPAINNLWGNSQAHPLFGNNEYDTLVTTQNVGLLYKLKKQTDVNFPMVNSQYQIQTGKTLFMGMEFNDQLTMAFDIETLTTDGYEFPNASRDGDEITIISICTNRGDEYVLSQAPKSNPKSDSSSTHLPCGSESELLKKFIKIVHQINPDTFIFHNGFYFDLPYIEQRCQKYGITFGLGRDGSEPYTFDTSMKLADRNFDYKNYCFFGRHCIDTMMLAMQADIVKRSFESYSLKYLAKEIGVAPENRTYVEGSAISDAWKGKHPEYSRQQLLDYALDDVKETLGLYKHFGQATFYSTQFLPLGYQNVFRLGSGVKIEYLFMRKYMQMGYSWSKPEEKRHISGGYADVYEYGYTDAHLVYADVASLYPSLGEKLNIQPSRDELGYYQKLLVELKQTRYSMKDEWLETKKKREELESLLNEMKKNEVKKEIKELKRKEDELNSKQSAVKILLNSLAYGYFSWSGASFNDYDEAERITKAGQKVLKRMITITEEWDGRGIKFDTDGGLFTIPPKFDDADQYCKALSDCFDEYIEIDNDGEYQGVIVFDKKSYAMHELDGSVVKKGMTIMGRSIEPYGRKMISECITHILNGSKWECLETYNYYKDIITGRYATPKEIGVSGNIKDNLEEYKHKVALGSGNGGRNPASVYELALKADKEYKVGDSITYYIKEPKKAWLHYYGKKALRKPRLSNYEKAEFIENYQHDYEMEYYVGRLETHIKRFLTVFGKEEFENYFGVTLDSKDKKRLKSYNLI